MNYQTLKMGFELKFSSENSLLPVSFTVWDNANKKKNVTPQAPLQYYSDVLTGMNFSVLRNFENLTSEEKKFTLKHLKDVDPYFKLYKSSEQRIKGHFKAGKPSESTLQFEKDFTELLNQCFQSDEIQFKALNKALNMISDFESTIHENLIYNFQVHFSKNFTEKLISFYSFLFHVRSLFALNYNFRSPDCAFDSVRCDSISDYLPKSDFTANDALIYWQFKKLSVPFTGTKDFKVEKLFINPLESAFKQYNYNACNLINNLPESFLTHSSVQKLEDQLYQIQMDWLLGSSTGLLFRIREELYGVTQGYNQIFWPDAVDQESAGEPKALSICFELPEPNSVHYDQAG